MQLSVPQTPHAFKSSPLSAALYGFVATSVLMTLHRAGVYQLLVDDESLSANEIAATLGLNHLSVRRVLDAAAAWGLVECDEFSKYRIPTQFKDQLDYRHESYLGSIFDHFIGNTIPLAEYLPEALKSGDAQWQRFLGANKRLATHPFENLFSESEKAQAFHDAMWNLSYTVSEELVENGILDETRKLVDVGGGSGAFVVAALKKKPDLIGIVYDLQEVEEFCVRNLIKNRVTARASFQAGNFWTDEIPSGDTYTLGYVMSNWNDEKCVELLGRIWKKLPFGGRVIILDRILDENRSGPFPGVMQDIAMMLETGGMHRTEKHFHELLQKSGYKNIRITRSSAEKHAIVGIKIE